MLRIYSLWLSCPALCVTEQRSDILLAHAAPPQQVAGAFTVTKKRNQQVPRRGWPTGAGRSAHRLTGKEQRQPSPVRVQIEAQTGWHE
jgi:hypothetical protein